MALTREAILGAQDVARETVEVPEWGGQVIVSAWTAAVRDEWERAMVGKPQEEVVRINSRARLVVLSVIDEQGNRLFADEDADNLEKKSAVVLDRIIDVVRRLNGLSREAVKDAKGN